MEYKIEKTDDFDKWLNSQKIMSYKNRLLARFERIKNGNFGDFKSITRSQATYLNYAFSLEMICEFIIH